MTELFPTLPSQKVRRNLREAELMEFIIRRGEGRLAASGAVGVETGQHTGRSAEDKYIVRDDQTDDAIWWDNAKEMSEEQFDRLLADFVGFARHKELFVQDLYAGADAEHRLNTRVVTEHAWQSLFIRHLLRRPEASELENFLPEFTVVDLPSFRAAPLYHGTRSETVIACNFTKRIVLIGGTSYAGEIKKSVFSYLNYLLPQKNVMPMHCSANVGKDGNSAVFFGLSGTGKTTLSADPSRELLGDDEHGWSEKGIFNFEGGCYAKTIRLSQAAEPQIWAASNRFATVLENVVIDPETRIPDFDDNRLAENSRSAYPLDAIANASPTGTAGHPKNIVMLTADAFGVLPPIAKLTPSQAMYHFLSGFTAKVAGTEKGMGSEPKPTFSTCFGAPFMPRHPSVYGNLLRQLIAEHGVDCWLVNTGWTGGKYGEGSRMPIKVTRGLLNAALSGTLKEQPMRVDPVFGFAVPVAMDGIDQKLLNPRQTWADPKAYDAMASKLAQMFHDNFAKFAAYVDAEVMKASPVVQPGIAAE
ncbi:phosphoenolpyruvate carboxykinase [Hyphomicrobium sp. MC1]|uniref:phosphoenolpyruvate carboxykinase n=1 Tax=Hyphomicrobium sp. (strain MC1) TaxID=717785 RepID=UPI000213DA68|nr:phosphoenolpyruvate carboxykinase [Hyphomicrobium sp. MC1]CCB63802.1 phosphoenolpyruvate carboxykinase [Hyphomicrobium sp. MC1]